MVCHLLRWLINMIQNNCSVHQQQHGRLIKIVIMSSIAQYCQTSSVPVANTTTETTLFPASNIGQRVIKANSVYIGTTFEGLICGVHSAAGSPNITINVKLGTTTILTTGVVATGSSTNAYFEVRYRFTYRTLGASGTLFAQGFYFEMAIGGTTNNFPMANTTTTTIDTTVDQTLDVTVTWGTASASNTITSTNSFIERRYL